MDLSNLDTKFSVVSLLGAPNAGKSTLVNAIIGTKISIVTPKVQTTRASIKGIYTSDESQIVFIDTPGIFKPKQTLERAIVREAWNKIESSDFLALLVDCRKGVTKDVEMIIKSLKAKDKKAVLILNKIDLVNKEVLFSLAQHLNENDIFDQTFMISALKNDGTEKLVKYFCDISPKGPWMFDEDQIMDLPVKFFAAEVTREKIFSKLQQELPYSVAVETEKWQETNKSVNIHQVIYVQKDGQKAIILGKNGDMIKQIGSLARRELTQSLDKKVNLFLFVKVREGWINDSNIMHEMGL